MPAPTLGPRMGLEAVQEAGALRQPRGEHEERSLPDVEAASDDAPERLIDSFEDCADIFYAL